jgi:hypothetical protein
VATKAKAKGKTDRQRKKFNLTAWLIGAGIVLLIAIPVTVNTVRSANLPGEAVASQGQTHIASVDAEHPEYNSNPPTSGWHAPNVASWGSYNYELPDELLVHNMEDGGVVLWYQMGTPEENEAHIRKLEDAARGFEKIVVVPRDDLETTYAQTAWRRLDKFDEFDKARIREFLKAFADKPHY